MISPETLQRAKTIIDSIEKLQGELAALFGSSVGAGAVGGKRRGRPPGSGAAKRRNMSAEGRARIAAAAKARWARFRAEQKKAAK